MKKTKLHKEFIIVSDDEVSVIFNTESNELFLASSDSDTLIAELDGTQPQIVFKRERIADYSKYEIEGITVCVAETCNMNCSYCFAQSGTYGTASNSIMKKDHFSQLEAKIWEMNPNGMKSIHFFGGEPLLAHAEMFAFCRRINNEYYRRQLPSPTFSITTNGTLITREVAQELHKYEFAVCVSLDGPEQFHNCGRLFKDGTGSFQKTLLGIRMLQREKMNIVVEATVMISQIETFDKEQLYNYFDFFSSIGVVGVGFFLDINERKSNTDSYLIVERFYSALVDYFFDLLIDGNSSMNIVFTNVLSAIARILGKKSASTCLAGLLQVFTSVDGDIYRCQTYFSSKHSKLGNINNLAAFEKMRQQLANDIDKRVPQKCVECKYFNFCDNKCPGANLLATGNERTPADLQCHAAKSLVNQTIYRMGLLGKDAVKHKRFAENLRSAILLANSFGIKQI